MISVAKKLNQKIEAYLYRHGFEVQGVREMVRNQLYLAFISGVGALLLSLRGWGFAYASGAFLGTFNFYSLARIIQNLVYYKRGAVVALLVTFYGRLLFTGFALFALLVWAQANVVALLAGVSTVIVTLLFWGYMFFIGNK